MGRGAGLLQGAALQAGQQQADGVAVGENCHCLSVILRSDFPNGLQHPLQHRGRRLRALHMPAVHLVAEIVHLLRPAPGDLAPGLLFPCAHTDFAQGPAAMQRQIFGDVQGAGGGTGAVQVAAVHRIDADSGKSPLQGFYLPPAPVGENTVVLALGNAVQVSLRLGVANQIDSGHVSLPWTFILDTVYSIGEFLANAETAVFL